VCCKLIALRLDPKLCGRRRFVALMMEWKIIQTQAANCSGRPGKSALVTFARLDPR
jgi:hypothetical protein